LAPEIYWISLENKFRYIFRERINGLIKIFGKKKPDFRFARFVLFFFGARQLCREATVVVSVTQRDKRVAGACSRECVLE